MDLVYIHYRFSGTACLCNRCMDVVIVSGWCTSDSRISMALTSMVMVVSDSSDDRLLSMGVLSLGRVLYMNLFNMIDILSRKFSSLDMLFVGRLSL